VAIEARAKAEASSLLFVIDGQTRGLASMIEVSEYITSKRDIFVCVLDIPEGQVRTGKGRKRGGVGGECVSEGQQRNEKATVVNEKGRVGALTESGNKAPRHTSTSVILYQHTTPLSVSLLSP
jgi:hypothetical protein